MKFSMTFWGAFLTTVRRTFDCSVGNGLPLDAPRCPASNVRPQTGSLSFLLASTKSNGTVTQNSYRDGERSAEPVWGGRSRDLPRFAGPRASRFFVARDADLNPVIDGCPMVHRLPWSRNRPECNGAIPDGLRTPTRYSPTPNSPTPNSPTPNSPAPNSPTPNSPAPNSPAPNSPAPNSSTPNPPASNSPASAFVEPRRS